MAAVLKKGLIRRIADARPTLDRFKHREWRRQLCIAARLASAATAGATENAVRIIGGEEGADGRAILGNAEEGRGG